MYVEVLVVSITINYIYSYHCIIKISCMNNYNSHPHLPCTENTLVDLKLTNVQLINVIHRALSNIMHS